METYWSPEAHQAFINALELYSRTENPWKQITAHVDKFGDHLTDDVVKEHACEYYANLTSSLPGHTRLPTSTSSLISPNRKNMHRKQAQPWTAAEDVLLRKGIDAFGTRNWKLISSKFLKGGRSDMQCSNRWKKVLQPGNEISRQTYIDRVCVKVL